MAKMCRWLRRPQMEAIKAARAERASGRPVSPMVLRSLRVIADAAREMKDEPRSIPLTPRPIVCTSCDTVGVERCMIHGTF